MFDVKFTIGKEGIPENLSRGCVTVDIDNIEMVALRAKLKIINQYNFLEIELSEEDINFIQITNSVSMKDFLSKKNREIFAA